MSVDGAAVDSLEASHSESAVVRLITHAALKAAH